jgi:hypothetical protein
VSLCSWKSRTRFGRPRLSREVRDLIARISQENRLWGSERIRGELLKLVIVRQQSLSPPILVAQADAWRDPDVADLPFE